jgi:hypothetical protein
MYKLLNSTITNVNRLELPTQEVLQQVLDYNPETGKLFWKPRDLSLFKDNGRYLASSQMNTFNINFAGKEALTAKHQDGYYYGNLFRRSVLAHRVIWKFVTGEDAEYIDHIDGNRINNIFSNLRSVSMTANMQNKCIYKTNTSGHVGVYLKNSKWIAQLGKKHVGSYLTKEEAISARIKAQGDLYHENHGRN